jgi:large subunit ribosomal protein L24
MSRVKREDTVMVISGKDRGKKGKVLKTIPSENKIIVEGVNFTKASETN